MMHDKLDRMVVQSNGRHLDIFLLSIYVVGPLGKNHIVHEHILDDLIGHLHPRYTIFLHLIAMSIIKQNILYIHFNRVRVVVFNTILYDLAA
jgi:hypothetical protein